MKVPDHPNIDVNVNAQMNHVSTTMSSSETNLCKSSFITSVILDHYWTCSDKQSVPFPSLGPFLRSATRYKFSIWSCFTLKDSIWTWSHYLAYNWHPCISVPWLMFYSMLLAANLARKCKLKSCSVIFFFRVPSPKDTCKQFIIRRHE